MSTQSILVTGGAGFIGSHTALVLIEAGFRVVVADNLCNSSAESLKRVGRLTGVDVPLLHADLRDERALADIFEAHDFQAVLHFAGLKAVGESVEKPLDYYLNNVGGTANLCKAMTQRGVFTLVFSSSATVYGQAATLPVAEDAATPEPTNPYAATKLVTEQMLRALARSDERWKIGVLRYFNPVGAHPSGEIGEDPNGPPNNLVPFLSQVVAGQRPELLVFGNDYPTPDGTGVRDYLHVMDLASGHVAALRAMGSRKGVATWNLGSGRGFSVLNVVEAYERVNGVKVPYRIVGRRAGDIASVWADTSKARHELGWVAELGLDAMVRDAWNWQRRNPSGFA